MSGRAPGVERVGLVSRTRPVAAEGELLTALGAGFDSSDGFAWLHDGGGLITSGVAARVRLGSGSTSGNGSARESGSGDGSVIMAAATEVERLLAVVEVDDPLRLPGTGPIAVGALPFHIAGNGASPAGTLGELIIPELVMGRTADGQAWVTSTSLTGYRPPLGPDRSGVQNGAVSAPFGTPEPREDGERDQWTAAVLDAVDMIARGPLAKVVLAREVAVEADAPFDVTEILRRLQQVDAACFVYSAPGIVGASPELLVRRRGDRVESRPMAGSTGRGATTADDDLLASRLRASDKERDEHRTVVDAVRRGLEEVCHQVVAGTRPEVVRLATVAHLATTVVGRLRSPAPSALALAGLLHPTPAVAGTPRDIALDTIARLESFDRGLYGGPVGWVDSRGDGDWAVALRCAQLDSAGTRARLTAGAGIVAGSDPDAEWAETEAKLEPMLRALVQP